MIGHEGKEVIGSVQYSAINESHYGKASQTGYEGKEVTGLVQCCATNESDYGKATIIFHEVK